MLSSPGELMSECCFLFRLSCNIRRCTRHLAGYWQRWAASGAAIFPTAAILFRAPQDTGAAAVPQRQRRAGKLGLARCATAALATGARQTCWRAESAPRRHTLQQSLAAPHRPLLAPSPAAQQADQPDSPSASRSTGLAFGEPVTGTDRPQAHGIAPGAAAFAQDVVYSRCAPLAFCGHGIIFCWR